MHGIFGPLAASWDIFRIDFGVILVCFWAARPHSRQKSRKPRKVMTLQHFLRFFQAPGGRKSTKNVSESSLEHQPCSKNALGASWDQFWSHFGSILGSKIGPKGDLKFASKKKAQKKKSADPPPRNGLQHGPVFAPLHSPFRG